MKKILLFGMLIVLLVGLPLASACNGESSTTGTVTTSKPVVTSTTSPQTTQTSGSTPVTTQTQATTSTSAAKPTKINIGLQGGITTLDPTIMTGGGGQAGNNVFEYLISFDTNNKMIPVLAESWSFSPDFLTLTVKLRQGVVFSTGDPLTADDVVFSLEMYKAQPGPTSAQLTQNFDGVYAIDQHTVEFRFPAINVQFLPQTLTNMFIMSKAQYDREGVDAWVKSPAGTGPYKFVTFKEGQYCDVTYNDKYRGAKPSITDARFYYVADGSTRISMLQAGEVDLIMDVPAGSIAQLQKAGYSRYDLVQPHDICLQFGYLDTTVPWAKVEVRKAINYAIDKDLLNEKVFGGVFQKGAWQMPWELGYDPSLDPYYPYDLTKARDLMAQAGYPNGFQMPLYYPSFMSWAKDMVDYLSVALQQIGITVKPLACSDFMAMASQWLRMHNHFETPTEMGVLLFDVGWPGNPDPSINLTNGFYFKKDNTLFYDEELNKIIDQILVTPDDTERAKLVNQAYTIINDTLPFLPIFTEVTCFAFKSNIQYTPSRGGMQAAPADVFDLTYK